MADQINCKNCKQYMLFLHPQMRNSRFDFNARYIRFDEAQNLPEFKEITEALANAKNFEPFALEILFFIDVALADYGFTWCLKRIFACNVNGKTIGV